MIVCDRTRTATAAFSLWVRIIVIIRIGRYNTHLQWLQRRHATATYRYTVMHSLVWSLQNAAKILNDAITPVCSVRSIIDGKNVTAGKFVSGYQRLYIYMYNKMSTSNTTYRCEKKNQLNC